MRYTEQKKYFEQAYATGSDIWTRYPYKKRGLGLLHRNSKDSLILDLGSGRGVWALYLANLGYRVIGVDYIESAIEKANKVAKEDNLDTKAKFIKADVLDLPFKDNEFDAATDFGLMQHLHPSNWSKYTQEVSRVLKSKGYFLKVVFSKETTNFMGFNPKKSDTGQFEKYGIHYYFFEKEEIVNLFVHDFELVEQNIEVLADKNMPILISTLFKKR